MNRKRIGHLLGVLVASLGLAGTSAIALGTLPPTRS